MTQAEKCNSHALVGIVREQIIIVRYITASIDHAEVRLRIHLQNILRICFPWEGIHINVPSPPFVCARRPVARRLELGEGQIVTPNSQPPRTYPLALNVLKTLIGLSSLFVKASRAYRDPEWLAWVLIVEVHGLLGLKSDRVWMSTVESEYSLDVPWQKDECDLVKEGLKEARRSIRPCWVGPSAVRFLMSVTNLREGSMSLARCTTEQRTA